MDKHNRRKGPENRCLPAGPAPHAARPAPARQFQGQPARPLVVLAVPGDVLLSLGSEFTRQRSAYPRLLQGRAARSPPSSLIRKKNSAVFSPAPTTAIRPSPTKSTRMAGCFGRRSAIPTTRIISTCRRPRPRRRPGCSPRQQCEAAAAKKIAPGATQSRLRRHRMELARHRRSGPRRRGASALWFSHFPCCSDLSWRPSPRWSASRPAPFRAISAARSISFSSASSRSGRRCRSFICSLSSRRF